MRAVTRKRYGGPEELTLEEKDEPTAGPGEVIVRVHAASINGADYRMMRADPFLVRLMCGLFGPKKGVVLGSDFAGVIARVGTGVEGYAAGDAVFGNSIDDDMGTFADFVRVSAGAIARKPGCLSFEEAASIPLAGVTALQGIRDLGGTEQRKRILVHGAGGGVGSFMVQIASHLGADVTAVCGPKNVQLIKELGADHVLDYTLDDFAAEDARYDVIFAVNGSRRLRDYRDKLIPGGRLVIVGGSSRQLYEGMFLRNLIVRGDNKGAKILTLDPEKKQSDLVELGAMLDSGSLRPVIDRSFALEEIQDAMRYVERGHVQGKVVIRVAA